MRVVYDPEKISFSQLLDTYWRTIDPTDPGGQFADRGEHYKTAIFYNDQQEKEIAEKSKAALQALAMFDKKIATVIRPAKPFYPAEEYHQDYYLKNPVRYSYYRTGCGRDRRLAQLWGSAPH